MIDCQCLLNYSMKSIGYLTEPDSCLTVVLSADILDYLTGPACISTTAEYLNRLKPCIYVFLQVLGNRLQQWIVYATTRCIKSHRNCKWKNLKRTNTTSKNLKSIRLSIIFYDLRWGLRTFCVPVKVSKLHR